MNINGTWWILMNNTSKKNARAKVDEKKKEDTPRPCFSRRTASRNATDILYMLIFPKLKFICFRAPSTIETLLQPPYLITTILYLAVRFLCWQSLQLKDSLPLPIHGCEWRKAEKTIKKGGTEFACANVITGDLSCETFYQIFLTNVSKEMEFK